MTDLKAIYGNNSQKNDKRVKNVLTEVKKFHLLSDVFIIYSQS